MPCQIESRALCSRCCRYVHGPTQICPMRGVDRLYKALVELESAGMLPSSHDEAARLASRMRLRGPQDVVTGVLAHVSFFFFFVVVLAASLALQKKTLSRLTAGCTTAVTVRRSLAGQAGLLCSWPFYSWRGIILPLAAQPNILNSYPKKISLQIAARTPVSSTARNK